MTLPCGGGDPGFKSQRARQYRSCSVKEAERQVSASKWQNRDFKNKLLCTAVLDIEEET
jgi:hypothetical protein